MGGNSVTIDVSSLDRLLRLANAARSHSLYGALEVGTRSGRARRRRLRSPEEVEALLTKELRRTAIHELQASLGLERCAIVLPIPGKEGFWSLVEGVGIPVRIAEKSFYALGDGLTGRVLQDQLIVSHDVLTDPRRSSKYGDTWVNENGTADGARRAYIGAPLWVQLTDASQNAIGAIYGIRRDDEFTKAECRVFETGTQLLSLGHDRLRSWRRRAETDLRQLRISQLWELPLREAEKYVEVLRQLKAEFPFSRLLLSLVDKDTASMRGVAAIGFRDDLVSETNRPVEDVEDCEEDILAWVYRSKITLPRIVTPEDPEWKKVHEITAFRHQVRNPLLLMPMTGSSGDLIGVVLAECPDKRFRLSPHELRRISLFVNHAGNLIEKHRQATGFRKLANVWGRIHTNVFNDDLRGRDNQQTTLAKLIEETCRYLEIRQAALYEVRDAGTNLQGVGAFGIDLESVLQHHISLEPVGITAQQDCFLLRCYWSNRPLSLPANDCAWDKSVLPQLTALDRCCLTGIRVMAGTECVGVFVFAHSVKGKNCVPPSMVRLNSMLNAMGHVIRTRKLVDETLQARRAASAYQSLALAITEIGKPTQQERAVPYTVPFTSVLRDAAILFDASLTQLHLCTPRELPRHSQIDISAGVMGIELVEMARYVEYSHHVRFPGRVLSNADVQQRTIRLDGGNGLTASAVKTLQPVTSGNVEADPFWSGNEQELRGPRAFLGLPLFFETDDQFVIYGVLTLTRLRSRDTDARDYSVDEVQSGQHISSLLSSAFRQRHEFLNVQNAAEEVEARVKRCLRWFRHDIPAMVSDIEEEARACEELQHGDVRKRLKELATLSEATRSVFVACALVLGEKSEKEASGSSQHVLDVEHLFAQLKVLLSREAKRGDTQFSFRSEPEQLLRVYGVREKPFMFCAYALVQNGLTACYHNRKKTSRDNPGRVELVLQVVADRHLKLIVRDDAGGVGQQELATLTAEQYSDWGTDLEQKSTGMGLYIVRRLVEEHLNGELTVSDAPWDQRTGATFTITTPLESIETGQIDEQRN